MSFQFHPLFPDATNEQKWEQIRLWRNVELASSDWTQLPDSPVNKSAWASYRESLRNLPAQGGNADDAVFPVKP
jgi:hypothetical protein